LNTWWAGRESNPQSFRGGLQSNAKDEKQTSGVRTVKVERETGLSTPSTNHRVELIYRLG